MTDEEQNNSWVYIIFKYLESIRDTSQVESEKINCETTKCENCQNHNYCDFEPHKSEVSDRMTKVTVGQLLDLIDNSRESEELVNVMDHNGKIQCTAMVCSEIWDELEDRTVNSIEVQGRALGIWLDDK